MAALPCRAARRHRSARPRALAFRCRRGQIALPPRRRQPGAVPFLPRLPADRHARARRRGVSRAPARTAVPDPPCVRSLGAGDRDSRNARRAIRVDLRALRLALSVRPRVSGQRVTRREASGSPAPVSRSPSSSPPCLSSGMRSARRRRRATTIPPTAQAASCAKTWRRLRQSRAGWCWRRFASGRASSSPPRTTSSARPITATTMGTSRRSKCCSPTPPTRTRRSRTRGVGYVALCLADTDLPQLAAYRAGLAPERPRRGQGAPLASAASRARRDPRLARRRLTRDLRRQPRRVTLASDGTHSLRVRRSEA